MHRLIIVFLFVACFAMAAKLDPWFGEWQGARRASGLKMLLGDSRRLFANHFFAKADVYFHQGYYPSIFDNAKKEEKSHMQRDPSGHHDHESEHEEETALEAPKDWIDAFGRNFYPSKHAHIETSVDEREILPWLKLAAELDPHKIETYVVAAQTLRKDLGKSAEAESFLREGLRENPDSYEILFELGRIRDEDHHDEAGARNLWELALQKWKQQEQAGAHPDELELMHIFGFLGQLEERQGHLERAIDYFSQLREISPSKKELTKRIEDLKEKQRDTNASK